MDNINENVSSKTFNNPVGSGRGQGVSGIE